MDWQTYLPWLLFILSTVAYVLDRVLRYRRSEEARESKAAEISALKAQTESVKAGASAEVAALSRGNEELQRQVGFLQEMISPKQREHFLGMKQDLEETNSLLQEQLRITQADLERERARAQRNDRRIEALEEEKKRLTAASAITRHIATDLALFNDLAKGSEPESPGTAIADWIMWVLEQASVDPAFAAASTENHVQLLFRTDDGEESVLLITAAVEGGSPSLVVRCWGPRPPEWGEGWGKDSDILDDIPTSSDPAAGNTIGDPAAPRGGEKPTT